MQLVIISTIVRCNKYFKFQVKIICLHILKCFVEKDQNWKSAYEYYEKQNISMEVLNLLFGENQWGEKIEFIYLFYCTTYIWLQYLIWKPACKTSSIYRHQIAQGNFTTWKKYNRELCRKIVCHGARGNWKIFAA